MIVFHYSTIYLLTEMVCICMLMAYLLLWLRSKHRSLDLRQGVVVRGVVGRGFRFRFTRFISCHKLCRYNNEQTTNQTKAINNSYKYIMKCDTNRAGHFTLEAHASRPVACPSSDANPDQWRHTHSSRWIRRVCSWTSGTTYRQNCQQGRKHVAWTSFSIMGWLKLQRG